MEKRLYRSKIDTKISGVCGGIGRYLNIDSTLIRIAWVAISLILSAGIGGIIAYIICAAIIPLEPDEPWDGNHYADGGNI